VKVGTGVFFSELDVSFLEEGVNINMETGECFSCFFFFVFLKFFDLKLIFFFYSFRLF
jgi:hypothetical protein